MVDPTPLKLAVSEDTEKCAAYLESLAKRCRDESWIAFAGVLFRTGTAFTNVSYTSDKISYATMMGGLLATAIDLDAAGRGEIKVEPPDMST